MDNKQAYITLGLTGNESPADIEQAYQTKLNFIEEKLSLAPTDTLKKKFEVMKVSYKQAHELLMTNKTEVQPPKQPQSSPLSQTKLADLPGAGPQVGNDTALEVGSVLADRFEIKAFIAQGGMGAVYRAFDKNRNEDIAIKVMLPGLMQNETARERFLDEARLSSQLSHPNIVNVFDVIQDDGLCFLTMELLEGQDLRELMNNRKLVCQNFTLEEVIEILEPVCEGLNHAHELTVHRDIKPENIYLTEDGKYKVMDFGIARVLSTSQRTQTGAASGTAYYMAPEQLKGAKNIDARADQYALAVLTYELLSGEVPAGAIEPLHELVKGINKKISASVLKALSPKPENRFENLNEFLKALRGKYKGKIKSASTSGSSSKGFGIAAVVLIAILGIGGLVGSGGLDAVWQALKPIDKELVARQRAGVAKLQGEINTYKKRLDNAQRNLNSDVRDAQRNQSNDLKYLEHWQRLTDDYLFSGNEVTELEGELSKAESLIRQESQESIKQATATMTQVRDGYKSLWAQFNAAETLLKTEEQSNVAFEKWHKRKKAYQLDNPSTATDAANIEGDAKESMKEGDFVGALDDWSQAAKQWELAFTQVQSQVDKIDNERRIEQERLAAIAAEKKRIAEKKAAEKKRIAKEKAAEDKRLLAIRHEMKRKLDSLYKRLIDLLDSQKFSDSDRRSIGPSSYDPASFKYRVSLKVPISITKDKGSCSLFYVVNSKAENSGSFNLGGGRRDISSKSNISDNIRNKLEYAKNIDLRTAQGEISKKHITVKSDNSRDEPVLNAKLTYYTYKNMLFESSSDAKKGISLVNEISEYCQ
jgi:serine/threonine protein kinase